MTFFKLNKQQLLFLIAIIGITIFKISLFPNRSYDINYFLTPWYEFLKLNGIKSFGYPFNNYNPPYILLLYISSLIFQNSIIGIKFVSLVFDFLFADAFSKIVSIFNPKLKNLSYLFAFGNPLLIVNSSLWGQCDVIYTTFIFYSLYYLLKQKTLRSLLMYSIAVIFKAQALFLLPFFIFLVFSKYITIREAFRGVLIFIFTFLLSGLIPILFGRPAISGLIFDNFNSEGVYNTYLAQASTQQQLVLYWVPTIYNWISNSLYEVFFPSVMLYVLAIISLLIWILNKKQFTKLEIDSNLILFAFTFTTTFVYILPKMQERYFFAAASLGLLLMFIDKKRIWMPLLLYLPVLVGDFRGAVTYQGFIPSFLTPTYGVFFVGICIVYYWYRIFTINNNTIK